MCFINLNMINKTNSTARDSVIIVIEGSHFITKSTQVLLYRKLFPASVLKVLES